MTRMQRDENGWLWGKYEFPRRLKRFYRITKKKDVKEHTLENLDENEVDNVSLEDLDAASTIYDNLKAGTHYKKQEEAIEWMRRRQ